MGAAAIHDDVIQEAFCHCRLVRTVPLVPMQPIFCHLCRRLVRTSPKQIFQVEYLFIGQILKNKNVLFLWQ